jgi:hypothetical protein
LSRRSWRGWREKRSISRGAGLVLLSFILYGSSCDTGGRSCVRPPRWATPRFWRSYLWAFIVWA